VAAGERLGDEMRLVLGVELVAEILDVTFDRSRGDPQLQRALFGGQAAGDALEHLALPLRQRDEIFLLPRKIHHQLRFWATFALAQLISLVITGLQEVECLVPIEDEDRSKCKFLCRFRNESTHIGELGKTGTG
jgi:hypothetical protein